MMKKLLVSSLAGLLSLVTPIFAQDWPSRPVVMINPFAAGSSVDVVSRLIAQKMAANTGQGITVGGTIDIRMCRIAARRRGVHAYVEFVHYVEGVHEAIAGQTEAGHADGGRELHRAASGQASGAPL